MHPSPLKTSENSSSGLIDKAGLEYVPDAVVIINDQARFIYLNQKACNLFQIKEDSNFGNFSFFDFIHAPDHLIASTNLFKRCPGQDTLFLLNLLSRDGNVFTGEINFSVFSTPENKNEYLLLTIRHLKDTDGICQDFDLNDMLNLLSHELRQPVNAIIGFSELMERNIHNPKGLNNEKLEKHNKLIIQQSIFLQNIIEQVFSLAMVNKFKVNKSLVNINDLLDELYEIFSMRRVQINKTNLEIILIKVPGEFSTSFYTDEVKLKQLFTNIIFNALKYTCDGFIEFGFHSYKENSLTFFVKDTGKGIPPEKFPSVFDKYNRLDNEHDSFQSIGLGLSLVKKLVVSLGGRIWIDSIQGHGTTFYFSLSI